MRRSMIRNAADAKPKNLPLTAAGRLRGCLTVRKHPDKAVDCR